MELGTGIFLSSLFLGTIALYIATKDRWNWKKVLLWPLAITVGLSVIGGAGAYIYSVVQERPKKELGLWGIQLGASPADVKFANGEPEKIFTGKNVPVDPNEWTYFVGPKDNRGNYLVRFKDGKVRFVMYIGSTLNSPSIQGISLYASLKRIEEKFGQPSYISRHKDGLRRSYSFDKYNVAFVVEKSKLIGLGVYDSSTGPIKYAEEGTVKYSGERNEKTRSQFANDREELEFLRRLDKERESSTPTAPVQPAR